MMLHCELALDKERRRSQFTVLEAVCSHPKCSDQTKNSSPVTGLLASWNTRLPLILALMTMAPWSVSDTRLTSWSGPEKAIVHKGFLIRLFGR